MPLKVKLGEDHKLKGKTMELDKIIEALEEKEVASEVLSAVKALDNSEQIGKLTKQLEAEKGKHSGILEDKKKFKDRADAAEKALKEIEDSKLTVEERVKNQVEELNQKLVDAEAAREQQEKDFKAAERETALSDITGSIKWSSAIPTDTAKLIVRNAFKDVDSLEKSVVDGKIKELTEVHKAFISAEAPAGSGGRSGGNAGNQKDSAPLTHKDIQADIWQGK